MPLTIRYRNASGMVKVKICGLSDPDMVGLAAREGADWIGFVFAPSARQITPEAAATLLLQVGKAIPVALLVDPDDALIKTIVDIGFPVLQLHGSETPERVAEVKKMTGREVWKAIGVRSPCDLVRAATYEAADRLLIDAPAPLGADQAGGHGEVFDWTLLEAWSAPKAWTLAGGLTPENVVEAIAATGASAVDVSSGVERRRGLKDADKVRDFIRAAKSA